MKLQFAFIGIAAISLYSCQNHPTTPISNNSEPSKSEQTCFNYVTNKDSASLSIIRNGNLFSGDLNYKLFEKDKNSGKVKGKIIGDTLIADYTFQSEGMESTRQVVFLKMGDHLHEGFGEITEKDGKTIFKDINNLNFKDGIKFTKTDCK